MEIKTNHMKEFEGDILEPKGYYYNLSREMLKDILIKKREEQERQDKQPWIKIPGKEHQPCLHDGCPECRGSGRKENGQLCVHHISCSCPKCSFYY